MRLSPLDIKKQDFKRVMRGVDPEEVQAFLNMVAAQWEELAGEQSRLEHKITELETKLQHYKEVEEALQEAVKTARESSRQTLEVAKRKAQSIVDAAAETAERIHNKVHGDQYELKRDIQALRSQRTEVIARLRNVLRTELEILGEFDRQFPVPAEPEEEELSAAVASGTSREADSNDDEQELDAIEDMAELDSAATEGLDMEAEFEEMPNVAAEGADDGAQEDADQHEDTLVFSAEQIVEDPPSQDDAPASAGDHTSRRDSAEMDKIRKILDDLA